MRYLLALVLLFVPLSLSANCDICFVGGDEVLHCRDSSIYTQVDGQLYSGCVIEKRCYRMGGAGVQCWQWCGGEPCFVI
ncbi:MAG TPA: hypothetical protein VF618_08340 [Thermoanaerobaculia bacterium]